MPHRPAPITGVLLSGGVDSSVLLASLLEAEHRVQPFYIQTDVVWADAELAAVRRFLQAVASPLLADLLVFDLPLKDLYGDHWSITGVDCPDQTSDDEAVFLPGRNVLLAIKPMVWCQQNGVQALALATLAGNPFADAQAPFLDALSAAMTCGGCQAIAVTRPFSSLTKAEVLALGRHLPLEHTFSCIAPRGRRHCGQCNKCAERQAAFRASGLVDPTRYASRPVTRAQLVSGK
jgi:7-cyano-7-deazaguanine synthase